MKAAASLVTAAVFMLVFGVSAQESKKDLHATGRVATVTGDSLTINTGAATLTFKVDASTKIVGKGVGTKSRDLKAQGKSPTLTDLVEQYDNVVVEYRDVGGTLQASRVDIRSKRTRAS